MFRANQNLNGSCHLTTPLSGWFVIRGLALATINLTIKLEVSNFTRYEDMKGDTKSENVTVLVSYGLINVTENGTIR